MNIFEYIGLFAGLVQLIGYSWYVGYVLQNRIKPNTSSWIIWAYGNAIVCWNYIAVGKELTLKETLPLVCAIASVISAIIFTLLQKFEFPTKREIAILSADLLITLYWILTGEHVITYILLQVSVAISFIPIIFETKKNPRSEHSGPWLVWSAAYLLLLAAEIPDGFLGYIYPTHYFLWHLAMGIMARDPKPLHT